jgi:hypothetical protein
MKLLMTLEKKKKNPDVKILIFAGIVSICGGGGRKEKES